MGFCAQTFSAHQYGLGTMKAVIRRALRFVVEHDMVVRDEDGHLTATRLGRRVSQLYIDPVTAVIIREALVDRWHLPGQPTEFSFLHLIAHTPDMWPKLRPYRSELEDLMAMLDERWKELFFEPPDPEVDAIGFEEFLGELKVARVLEAWVEEALRRHPSLAAEYLAGREPFRPRRRRNLPKHRVI